MTQPDFERARAYVLERLETELPPTTRYHSLEHTKDEVVPAIEKLALLEGVPEEELLLLKTAAYFHDIGFVKQREDHEAIGARVAEEMLPNFGYTPSQIQVIQDLIMATKLPQSPHTHLEQILADADLDVLGRSDYMSRNQALRDELASYGRLMSDEEWYSSQLKFLQTHHYFTQAARSLRNDRKQQNIIILVDLLANNQ